MAADAPRPHSLDIPPDLARPSSLSLRPHLSVQTRIRARSVTSGAGAAAPLLPYLSPTLAGSPVLPSFNAFIAEAPPPHHPSANGFSSLSRESRAAREGRDTDDGEDAADGEDEGVPGTEESGSTASSDSPPVTPVDPPSLSIFGVAPEGKGPEEWSSKRREDVKLEGQTRIGVRRGRSFTSLLMPSLRSPPAIEHPDPIAEMTTPPLSDIESGEPIHPHPSSLFYPPKPSHHHPSSSEPSAPKTLRNFVPQVILLGVLFLSSLAVIAALVASLPNLFIPHSVSDLPALTSSLSIYRASSQFAELHLFVVLSALFLWKQCFSIPGSILTNILFGALYGTGAGTSWACLWTAAGSTGAYYIAKTISPLVEHYFATPLAMTRRALNLPLPNEHRPLSQQQPSASTSDLFSHLLLARFFPLLPYSVLNVISGVLGLPVPLFFITLILGSFPFNFATVSIGELVALAASDPSTSIGNKIWSFPVLRKLVLVTVISVLPVVFKKPLQKWAAQAEVGVAVREAMGVARTGCSAVRGSVVRTVGGWMGEVGVGGMVRSGGSPAPAPFFGGGGGGGGGRRQWRHKFNPSWGGDGYRFVESSGSEDGGMLA